MLIDVAQAERLTVYRALIGVVTPRPIAWVTSIDDAGRVNLAPFSFFNTFGGNPPVVIFAPNRRRDGSKKDTLRNIEATKEFVIHSVVADLAPQMNLSSKELPYGESEVELTGLSLVPSQRVQPPRVAEAPVQMECRLREVLQIGEGVDSANLVIGEILVMHIADAVLDADGRIDPTKLQTIGRLGGDFYCHTRTPFAMKRP